MKNRNLISWLIFALAIGVVLSTAYVCGNKSKIQCTPGTLQLKADIPGTFSRSKVFKSVDGGTISLKSAQIEIQNLKIENNLSSEMNEAILQGPYLLDILSGTAPIDEVLIQPGKYKKVVFDFFSGSDNGNHSIVLDGIFTNAKGVAIPFIVYSETDQTIQLPIVESGMNVNSENIWSMTILYDLHNSLNKLDFDSADRINGGISITKDYNTGIYKKFLALLSKHIDVETTREN